ncbi:hypothetical protein F5883DRAFT_581720 [Diaporthe sp. PMI_573]|nr:hypothetical protein F5883DRAFT_581720 [Diaporthaceae sp. PMI_573]
MNKQTQCSGSLTGRRKVVDGSHGRAFRPGPSKSRIPLDAVLKFPFKATIRSNIVLIISSLSHRPTSDLLVNLARSFDLKGNGGLTVVPCPASLVPISSLVKSINEDRVLRRRRLTPLSASTVMQRFCCCKKDSPAGGVGDVDGDWDVEARVDVGRLAIGSSFFVWRARVDGLPWSSSTGRSIPKKDRSETGGSSCAKVLFTPGRGLGARPNTCCGPT